MAQTGAPTKICVVCGQDCSAKPRVKDGQGRYSCKTCHEAATKKAAARKNGGAPKPVAQPGRPAPAAEAEPAFDGLDNAAVLAGLEAAPAMAAAPAADQCPSCGMPMAGPAVVCMNCGFNRASGSLNRVKVSKDGPGAGAVADVAATVLIRANPLAWTAAAVLAGAIGAGVWYYIAMQTGKEARFVPLGIGVLVGLFVKVTSGSYSGATSGGIAVAAALASCIAGKYLVFNAVVEEVEQELGITMTLSDDELIDYVARDVAARKQSMGAQLVWPPDVDPEFASGPESFPAGVWDEATAQWAKAAPDWKSQYKAEKEAELKDEYESNKAGGFLLTFVSRSTLFILGGLAAALWVGSGGDVSGAVGRRE